MSPLGFVIPALAVGAAPLLIRPKARGFLPFDGSTGQALPFIQIQAILEEVGTDTMEITDHPVEQNAAISEHAYRRPAEVLIRAAWSNSPSGPGSIISQAVGAAATLGGTLATVAAAIPSTVQAAQSILRGANTGQVKDIYDKLLALKDQRVPFRVETGKRRYDNMLIRQLIQETDGRWENALLVTIHCREVFIVATQLSTVSIDPTTQTNPEKTAPDQNLGFKQTIPATTFKVPPIPKLLSTPLTNGQ